MRVSVHKARQNGHLGLLAVIASILLGMQEARATSWPVLYPKKEKTSDGKLQFGLMTPDRRCFTADEIREILKKMLAVDPNSIVVVQFTSESSKHLVEVLSFLSRTGLKQVRIDVFSSAHGKDMQAGGGVPSDSINANEGFTYNWMISLRGTLSAELIPEVAPIPDDQLQEE